MSAALWAGVVVIGGACSVLRFLVDAAVTARTTSAFPYGTLTVNLSGSVLLGLLTAAALSDTEVLLAATAAVGSYTTFSTWMFETQRLGEERQVAALAANVVVSLVAGIAAAALGRLIGGAL